jgi:hypothetical protein
VDASPSARPVQAQPRSAAIAGATTIDEVRIAGGVAGRPPATGELVTASFRDMVTQAEMGAHPYLCIGRVEARPRGGGGAWDHSGSGVLVGRYHLLTAAHIFMDSSGGWEEAPFATSSTASCPRSGAGRARSPACGRATAGRG